MTLVQILLLLVAGVISLVALFKEYWSEKGKKIAAFILSLLIIGTVMLQIVDTRDKTADALKEEQQRVLGLAKADKTILKINLAYDTIKAIQKGMHKQLISGSFLSPNLWSQNPLH